MTTLLAFVFTLAVLIIVHEFGHYYAARICGVKVLRFSVGFGGILASRRDRRGTEWALSSIPLGGYVKMLDEREGDVAESDLSQAFNRKGVGARILVVAAGPLANLLLAILLYWALYATGVPALKPILGEPSDATPAALAGIRPGEEVLRVNGQGVDSFQDLHLLALRHGFGARQLQLETRDPGGYINYRRLDLDAVDRQAFERDPMGQLGLARYLPPVAPVIGEVVAGGVAERSGLRGGDRILEAGGQPTAVWEDVVKTVQAHPEQSLRLRIQRDDQVLAMHLVPDRVEQGGKVIGRIGAGPRVDAKLFDDLQTMVRYAPLAALQHAAAKTWELAVFSLEMLGRMVIGQASLENLSGPITIADYAGQTASMGITAFVAFIALISVSLGVLNLLPVPVLDGGHLLYYLAEAVTGRPVPDRVQEIGQRIGIALIGFLMFFALYNDLLRLFTR